MSSRQFTIRRLMVVGVELGVASWIHRETIQHSSRPFPWVETGISLVFLNLLIGGPASILVWGIERMATRAKKEARR
jgi:hypothetical protein